MNRKENRKNLTSLRLKMIMILRHFWGGLPINNQKSISLENITLNKFQNDRIVKSLSLRTFQEASDFIWDELKELKKFKISCSTIKKEGTTITYFRLEDHGISYIVRNKISSLGRNIFRMGDNLITKNKEENIWKIDFRKFNPNNAVEITLQR